MRSTMILAMVAAVQALALGGEAGLDAGAEVFIAPKGAEAQSDPAAAFAPSTGSGQDGKGTYLVVWSDGSGLWGGDADIHGLRLKADGSAIDAQPIVISKAKDFQKRPRAVWTGREWLVVWQDLRNGKDCDVYAARVSADGKVLDPDGIAVCAEKADQVYPAVASDGAGGSLVVWADYRAGNYDIHGAAVNDGKAGPSSGLVVMADNQMSPSVAWSGKHYLVGCGSVSVNAFSPNRGFCLVRVGPDGKSLDAKPKFYSNFLFMKETSMGIASGHALLMSYYGVLLDADGAVLADDNPGRPVVTSGSARFLGPGPKIGLTDTGEGAAYVYGVSVGGSGEWFLTANQKGGAVIRCILLRAKDGRVLVDGKVLTPQGACEKAPFVCGGPAGEFLLLYERNNDSDANQKVCARVVKVK